MNSRPGSPPSAPPRRHGLHGAAIAGAIALTIAMSGFFMGLRETSRSSARQREAWKAEPQTVAGTAQAENTPVAVDYAELPDSELHANYAWTNDLSSLVSPPPDLATFAQLTSDEQEIVRLQRASRRQYDGAPPTAPHPLDQMSAETCLACHGQPTLISGVPVAQMSHQPYQNCLQCHVSAAGPTSTWRSRPVSLADGNRFTGKEQPGYGSRAYVGAPPTIPHSTWMRQNCINCHGPGGTSALRTSHPGRHSCLQCHAPNATADQAPTIVRGGLPPPLPPPSGE